MKAQGWGEDPMEQRVRIGDPAEQGGAKVEALDVYASVLAVSTQRS
jgi:hypothetical protein